jgi:hypothetical protein
MSVARPPATLMRNPLKNLLKKHVIIAAGISAVAAVAYKHFVSDWRKAQYQEFYRYLYHVAYFSLFFSSF